MSYARRNEKTANGPSDIYVYLDVCGLYLCVMCELNDSEDPFAYWSTASAADMIAHVQRHADAGHAVPTRTIRQLKLEVED